MKEPVDHILRPRLPWRPITELALTECGFNAAKVQTITRADFAKRLKDLGQQRTAMLTCMTCSQTAYRWRAWEEDPRKALGREIEWETGWIGSTDRGYRLRDELHAIARLIEKHPEEFTRLVSDIAARREWLDRKDAKESVQ
jgi:hypothetical protein